MTAPEPKSVRSESGLAEVFGVFLRLGLTSFVVRRRWFDERAYADLVALCQFLPGPVSSQVRMAVGLLLAALYDPA